MTYQMNQQDVEAVLESYNVSGFNISEVMSIMDDDAISTACSEFDDEAQQMEVAYDAIAKQLFQQGYISEAQIREFGNIAILN